MNTTGTQWLPAEFGAYAIGMLLKSDSDLVGIEGLVEGVTGTGMLRSRKLRVGRMEDNVQGVMAKMDHRGDQEF
jgi:hypothetical protein